MRMKFGYWIFLVLMLGFLSSCENDMAEVAQYFEQDDAKVIEAKDVVIYYSDSAVVRVVIRGPKLLNYIGAKEPRSEFVDGLIADFYDRDHVKQSRLVANFGVKYDNKNIVVVQDSVVITTIRQEKLETEELTWNEKTGQIETDKFVKVSTPKEVVYGYGLIANDDFSYWKIKAVTGRMAAEGIVREFR